MSFQFLDTTISSVVEFIIRISRSDHADSEQGLKVINASKGFFN
jgi:hypothetical protein